MILGHSPCLKTADPHRQELAAMSRKHFINNQLQDDCLKYTSYRRAIWESSGRTFSFKK